MLPGISPLKSGSAGQDGGMQVDSGLVLPLAEEPSQSLPRVESPLCAWYLTGWVGGMA